MRKPLRARRLAVGAGNAAHPHRIGWTAVKVVREETGLRLETLDAGIRQPPCPFKCALPGKARAFPDHRRATALDRLRDVAPAVSGCARPGKKSRARRGPPAVG